MNRLFIFWLITVITLSAFYSCRECDLEIIMPSEHSGFGYASGLCFPQAEVEFTVFSSSDSEVNAILRARSLHLNDIEKSLIMIVNGHSSVLSFEPTTDWQEINISLSLKSGNNQIVFRKTKELFYDICIDYLEIL